MHLEARGAQLKSHGGPEKIWPVQGPKSICTSVKFLFIKQTSWIHEILGFAGQTKLKSSAGLMLCMPDLDADIDTWIPWSNFFVNVRLKMW